jgi:hypothetical protein
MSDLTVDEGVLAGRGTVKRTLRRNVWWYVKRTPSPRQKAAMLLEHYFGERAGVRGQSGLSEPARFFSRRKALQQCPS